MAILPAIPGISIVILVDDEPAQEYQPPSLPTPIDSTERQNLPKARCFIESRAGSPYKIRYRVSPLFSFPDGTDVLVFSVFVDGKPFSTPCVSKEKLHGRDHDHNGEISYCQRDLPDGSSESYGLAFEDLTLMEEVDCGTIHTDIQRIKTLGAIQVVVQIAKRATQQTVGHSLDDDKRNVSLAFSHKKLILNGHGQSHGTKFVC
ncbi:hypothetical protein IL306_002694 [Fusarium sp. DS 682]|nr:hypothetical protein IL306_002694 [Fusarium sp. DS 682]